MLRNNAIDVCQHRRVQLRVLCAPVWHGVRMSVIESQRLRLRWLSADDAAFILQLLTERDFLANVGERGVRDLAGAARYIEEARRGYARLGFGLYAVDEQNSGATLGLCGLLRRDSHPDVELGFALLPAARGRGYALEAAAATREFGHGNLGLARLVALTAPQNSTSMHILQRIGFKDEGLVAYGGEASRLFVSERAVPNAVP
jgi:RimJ/RimL family protein N-acetyltransferase